MALYDKGSKTSYWKMFWILMFCLKHLWIPLDKIRLGQCKLRQCPQIGRQYGIKNKAAIAWQCKLNGKLIAVLLFIPYSSPSPNRCNTRKQPSYVQLGDISTPMPSLQTAVSQITTDVVADLVRFAIVRLAINGPAQRKRKGYWYEIQRMLP